MTKFELTRFCVSIFMVLSCLCLVAKNHETFARNNFKWGMIRTRHNCNMYEGSWVYDKSLPLYDSSACSFLHTEFNCLNDDRSDRLYLQYKWQPTSCDLPRRMLRTPLTLNSHSRWDYVRVGNKTFKDMDRMVAFRKGLITSAKEVDSDVDSTKTKVFFQGISPSHYNGNEWNEPGVRNCLKETKPMTGSSYPGGLTSALSVVEEVLSKIKKPVHLLNITRLSQLRKDAHPAKHNGLGGMDCTHWCIAGLPDTWNQLLYAQLIH